MSDNEIIPEAISKEESENTFIPEVKKEKKKFSILLVSADNNAKLEIEGKVNSSINNPNNPNNLITFSKNVKSKKSLKNVIKEIKDINDDLDVIENNLTKSIKTFRSKPSVPKTNISRINNSLINNRLISDYPCQIPKMSNNNSRVITNSNNVNLANINYDNNRYDRTYLLEKENKRLKEHNRRLESEIEDYKKYLDNMANEKKLIMQSIKTNSKNLKTYNTDYEDNKPSNFLRYRDPKELYNSSYKSPIYFSNHYYKDEYNHKNFYKSDNF